MSHELKQNNKDAIQGKDACPLPLASWLTAIAYLFPLTPFATIYVVWEMG